VRRNRATQFGTLTTGLALVLGAAPASDAKASWRAQVLACLRAEGWDTVARGPGPTFVTAGDGHTEVQLVFWRSAAAAQRSVPGLAPVGVGWVRRLSFRAGAGFTIADEQSIYRCAR
jgi:hypothetical protein